MMMMKMLSYANTVITYYHTISTPNFQLFSTASSQYLLAISRNVYDFHNEFANF